MTAHERWRRVQELFDALEPLPAAGREAELSRLDPPLAREVAGLFRALEQEEAAQQNLMRAPSPVLPKPELPGLRLLEPIGAGGSGVVYEAIRTVGGAEQKVAVKVLHEHRAEASDLQRFTRECKIMAALNHPGVVHFLDAGMTADQRPYLVMELAEGRPITDYCDEQRLRIEDRLRLMIEVCETVAFAHARLIVHLDLKPSNILVTSNGAVKVLDLGTARLLQTETASTVTQQMTPRYASPEQLRAEPLGVSSDVYSLGLILFELLSGGWPFAFRDSIVSMADRATGAAQVRGLAEACTAESAQLRDTTLPRLTSALAGDLALICLKALATDVSQRYQSVAELADDLRRYQVGEPVRAHPPTLRYRATKFAVRYAGRLALAAVFVAAIAGAAVYSTLQAREARQQARRAERINDFMNTMLGASNPLWINPLAKKGPNVTLLDVVNEMRGRIGEQFGDDPAVETKLRRTLGVAYASVGKRVEAREQLDLALRKQLLVAPADHPDAGLLYRDLAEVQFLSLEMPLAEKHAGLAVGILTRSQRPGDKVALMEAYMLLGASRNSNGRGFDSTAPALRRAVELSRELFGNGRSTPGILNTLATFLLREGKFEEAEQCLKESMAIRHAAGGPQTFDDAFLARDVGMICLERGQLDCAMQRLGEALSMIHAHGGKDNIYGLYVQVFLARAKGLVGRSEEALRELELVNHAFATLGSVSSPLHRSNIDQSLGLVHMAAGQAKAAEPAFRRALAVLQGSAEVRRMAVLRSQLGECLWAVGKKEEALAMLTESHQVLLTAAGPQHVWTVAAKARLDQATR